MDETSFNERIVYNNVEIFIKREDIVHPQLSGNKFRKLKYNLIEARRQKKEVILSFGGAFSNHIAALAAAGKLYNFQTIGVIRGDELECSLVCNPTLAAAKTNGMKFHFVSRENYRRRNDFDYHRELAKTFGEVYIVPEGGTNELAIRGCEEILNARDNNFDTICVAVGTGGTIAGIINSALPHQRVLGFPALKGGFLPKEISKFARKENWELIDDFTFGGYAKINVELVDFINAFYEKYHILLDPIYTSKMMFGIFRLIDGGYFPTNSRILAVHTGGLQAIEGMNIELARKKISLIKLDV